MNLSSLQTTVAYFSMEIALDPAIPTYSGGLGVLAGDTLRSAADLAVPIVGVTLLDRKGYFQQHLDEAGNQTETAVEWRPESILEPVDVRTSVQIEGRPVHIRAWRYVVRGISGHEVPVYLLDTQLPENAEADRKLTDYLYGGDSRYRLCQELVLGMGGAALLRALGCNVELYHMNEGHSALLTLYLLEWQIDGRCAFTTHTPVPAGHDRFPIDLAHRVLGDQAVALLEAAHCIETGDLNMTHVALRLS